MSYRANVKNLKEALQQHLWYSLAKDHYSATQRDKLNAAIFAIRDFIARRWIKTQQSYYEKDIKRIYYLSLEFLLGRLLHSSIINLGLLEEFKAEEPIFGLALEELFELEWDAGLGNGGLGRLAACFLDSMASLSYPGYGYGIRYEYGIFYQRIKGGYQIETPDNWLRYGNAWEFPRSEILYMVDFHGNINNVKTRNGKLRMEWVNTESVMAMAYDYPVPGYQNDTVNTLRLWSAKSTRDFDLAYFNSGDYIEALKNKNMSETISKVLYPNDKSEAGKELRLKQQYFFVSATLQDIIRRFKKYHSNYRSFPDKVAMQLNDTHPAIAIPELMRILLDEEGLEWDEAWQITNKTFAYTNHTILPEALEVWSEDIVRELLPRHLQLIQEIDRRFMIQVTHRFPDNPEKRKNLAIISNNDYNKINMARLAIIGSHKVNGVSELHSRILKENVFDGYYSIWPERFCNVTNGVTPRRWLLEANPKLSSLITDAIGDKWITDLSALQELEGYTEKSDFLEQFMEIKLALKKKLADFANNNFNVQLTPSFMFDCQAKRFHEYKRQLLNILHVITHYNRILKNEANDCVPRTVIFSGKSAPGYFICKLIIKLIHSVAAVIEANPRTREKLEVIFLPNYSVSIAQKLIPAADLSEQISTAGFEASGTGNMKFALNGALTIGTLDGANVEIREEVHPDNFFLFGLTADEMMAQRQSYNPYSVVDGNQELALAIEQLRQGYFSPEQPDLFAPILQTLFEQGDRFFVLADYEEFIKCQEKVDKAYKNSNEWAKMAVLNIARSGKFSSDRAINTYANKIWNVKSVPQNVEET